MRKELPIHTFARKPKVTERSTASKSTTLGRVHLGQRLDTNFILRLQRTIGNHAVERLLDANGAGVAVDSAAGAAARMAPAVGSTAVRATGATALQANLRVNAPGDEHEYEADRVAERIMRTSEPEELHAGVRSEVASGRPQLGFDPVSVRLHTDEQADCAARALNARAFTVGHDIYFDRREYSPSTSEGQRLLAHELVHVAQQIQSPGAANAVMRQVKVPSAEEVRMEIGTLHLRLAELLEREAREGHSIAERAAVEHRLAWFEQMAAAPDLTRRNIIYLRERIRQLRDETKNAPPSSAREEIGVKIQEHERELAKALEANVARLEKELAGLQKVTDLSPATASQLNAAETELLENEAELKILRRIFTPERAEKVAQTYKKEVRPDMSGHCMGAVYKGAEALYSPKASADIKAQVIADSNKILKETKRDTNDVDRIMETLRQHSIASERVPVRYSSHHKAWEPSVEKTMLNMVSPDYPGWYFFGLSVSGGYHSVILAVDNSEGQPRIYWMDQFSKGFTNEVTGKLDKEMKVSWLEPSYGFTDSTVWPLIPTDGAVVEIK